MAATFDVLSTGVEPRQSPTGAPAEVMAATFVTVPAGGTGYVAVQKGAGWREALLSAVEQQAGELLSVLAGSPYIAAVGVSQELAPDFRYVRIAEARVVVPEVGDSSVSVPLTEGWPAALIAAADAEARDLLAVFGA